MNKKIKDSIKNLIEDYKRLKLKEKKKIITKEEKLTLDKLVIFLGKE